MYCNVINNDFNAFFVFDIAYISNFTCASQRFAMDHMMQDHLIVGFASEKANPFREKTWSCDLL
jgi:hypothetical protein